MRNHAISFAGSLIAMVLCANPDAAHAIGTTTEQLTFTGSSAFLGNNNVIWPGSITISLDPGQQFIDGTLTYNYSMNYDVPSGKTVTATYSVLDSTNTLAETGWGWPSQSGSATISGPGTYTYTFTISPASLIGHVSLAGITNVVAKVDVLDVPQGVPEPATWTLSILGFGLVGAAMRTKRRTFNALISS